ncbi:MAG TPA: putative Ig domain-containing protein [Steroidobacteraceae bacterium]
MHPAALVIFLTAAAGVYPSNTSDKPTISGTPATSASVGSPYAFEPSAHDPYGAPLAFSINNKPAWANFSIATGSLYGAPTSAQAGTYANIEITVSNGKVSAALPPFSITVKNGATSTTTASATLSWTPPTENADGTALTDLAGVHIYYGNSAADLSQVVQVSGTDESSYTIKNLAAGTWYFAASAYTTTGAQSALSSVVSKSIP